MKLTETNVERIALDFYLESVRDPAIPDDLCAELYTDLLNRLKPPEGTDEEKCIEANDAYVRRARYLSLRDVMRREKRREEKIKAVEEACVCSYDEGAYENAVSEDSGMLERIRIYIEKTGKNESRRRQSFLFILSVSRYLPYSFLKEAARLAGVPHEVMTGYTDRLSHVVRKRVGERREALEARSASCYAHRRRTGFVLPVRTPGFG